MGHSTERCTSLWHLYSNNGKTDTQKGYHLYKWQDFQSRKQGTYMEIILFPYASDAELGQSSLVWHIISKKTQSAFFFQISQLSGISNTLIWRHLASNKDHRQYLPSLVVKTGNTNLLPRPYKQCNIRKITIWKVNRPKNYMMSICHQNITEPSVI